MSTPDIPDKLYFKIGEVAKIISVAPHVLRYWESEMELTPHRSHSGTRLYRKIDISNVLRIKRLVHDEGYTLAAARDIFQKDGQEAVTNIDSAHLQQILERLVNIKQSVSSIKTELRK